GDLVEIRESRPLSRLKRWVLVRIVEKNKEVDVAALRQARRTQAGEELIQTLEKLTGPDE
ncbi:MAG: 30S ribosomal protein S17, partial [Aureliella sp.]